MRNRVDARHAQSTPGAAPHRRSTADFWSMLALGVAAVECLADLAYIVLSLVWRDRMALPPVVLRFMVCGMAAAFMATGSTPGYWVLGLLLVMTSLFVVPLSFLDVGDDFGGIPFHPYLLALGVVYFLMGVVIVTAAIKREFGPKERTEAVAPRR